MNINPSEIKKIALTDPTVLKHMLRNPNYDKRKITGIISQMFKYDVGLEFELFGSLSSISGIKIQGTDKSKDRELINKIMEAKLRVMSYSEDHYHDKSLVQQSDLNEIRIRLRGHLGLVPLCNSLNYMRKMCMIPLNSGGIHIHIDCTKFIKGIDDRNTMARWFESSDIQQRILDIFGGYTGTYNKPGCGVKTKGFYVNISRLDTVEFRIGRLNFDYSTIATWIYKCQLLVKECLHKNKILSIPTTSVNRVNPGNVIINQDCTPDEAESIERIRQELLNTSIRLSNSNSSSGLWNYVTNDGSNFISAV